MEVVVVMMKVVMMVMNMAMIMVVMMIMIRGTYMTSAIQGGGSQFMILADVGGRGGLTISDIVFHTNSMV